MRRIGVLFAPNNKRSKIIADMMSAGFRRHGIPHVTRSSLVVRSNHDFDTIVHYGLSQGLRVHWNKQKNAGSNKKALYIDLGYWGRRCKTRWDGYHKIILNDRHPTEYFQNREHPSDRFERFGVEIKPWRKSGKHILVAGMSAKAAAQEGFQPHQWERATISELRKHTDRPILYRPKPNWMGARPITGSNFGRGLTLEESLQNCHAVVTHHSNVAVDAILEGIPCICPHGVASVLSGKTLAEIEDPPTDGDRLQWASDIAYTQWSVEEMAKGKCYKYLVEEDLL